MLMKWINVYLYEVDLLIEDVVDLIDCVIVVKFVIVLLGSYIVVFIFEF